MGSFDTLSALKTWDLLTGARGVKLRSLREGLSGSTCMHGGRAEYVFTARGFGAVEVCD